MASIHGKVERREHQRFRLKENIFVVVTDKVGPLLDISSHGLSFSVDADEQFAAGETLYLDIFGEDSPFSIKNIPFQVASEAIVSPKSPFSVTIRRRYGVQFGELNDLQKSQLEYFIQHSRAGNA